MHCTHCGRRLIEPTVTIRTKRGPLYWGPKCAAKAGLTNPAKRQILTLKRRVKPTQRATAHDGQADWIDTLMETA